MLTKIAWYTRRLRVMERRELLHRAFERLYIATCRFRYQLRQEQAMYHEATNFEFVATTQKYFEVSEYFSFTPDSAVDSDLYLGYEWHWNGQEASWHMAPDSGLYWPRQFFNKIDYRQGNPVGDVRCVWEVSRFQHQLENVARAVLTNSVSQQERAEQFRLTLQQIRSWFLANPLMMGVHYVSSMECALRLIAVTHIMDTVRDEVCESDWQAYLNFVEQHANFIIRRLSLYSSAGNHTIAEAAGLVYAGVLFPEFKRASTWRETGTELLNKELCRQIHSDGGPLEQSTWYLKFVVELGLLANKLLVREKRALEAKALQRLCKARDFLSALQVDATTNFEYGDSDHGYALGPALKLLELHATSQQGFTRFEHTGVELLELALKIDDVPRINLIFLVKNLGMAPLFGHGHADCLSLCCAVNGEPLLIDTGTFGYNIGDRWRRYFRSVNAHNTVAVNNLDQSSQLSNFQWSEDIAVRSLHKPTQHDEHVYSLFACHSGFQSVGAVHSRAILINLLGELVVWDCVTSNDSLDVVANWHFASHLHKDDHGFTTTVGGVKVEIITSAGPAEIFRESLANPVAGWRSTAYGERRGIDTLKLKQQRTGTVSILTQFTFAQADVADGWWEPYIEELKKLI